MSESLDVSMVAAVGATPDLEARAMNITAYYATDRVYASAVCENVGMASATGPFTIQVEVTIQSDDGTTEYAENFLVPEGVTIHGKPRYTQMMIRSQAESHLVRPPVDVSGLLQTTYVTGQMYVPLLFRDIPPHATYTAAFLIDIYGQVTNDYNRVNNVYNSDVFWFVSLESQQQEGMSVIERGRTRQIE